MDLEKKPKASIIILCSFNKNHLINRTIPSIKKTVQNIDYEIIVVYNGFSEFKIDDPKIRFIRSPNLLHVACGYNLGIKASKYDFIALFHDDVEIFEKGWLMRAVQTLQKKGIAVSLFIDPIKKQIQGAQESGATIIELHTGRYDHAQTKTAQARELKKIKDMTRYAKDLGLTVNAGHGLKYHNTKPIARIPGVEELNIGHSIISRAIFVGLSAAVREMVKIIRK